MPQDHQLGDELEYPDDEREQQALRGEERQQPERGHPDEGAQHAVDGPHRGEPATAAGLQGGDDGEQHPVGPVEAERGAERRRDERRDREAQHHDPSRGVDGEGSGATGSAASRRRTAGITSGTTATT